MYLRLPNLFLCTATFITIVTTYNSNLLNCSLRIRGKSRLVKFSVRYESFYLKNCPRRNIQFSVVAIQKWSHFIFHPQQYLMEEKTNSSCFPLTFIHSIFATLRMELSKKLSTSIFPNRSDFQRNHSFPSINAFNPLFFFFVCSFILFYLIFVETLVALKFKVPFKFVFSSTFTYKDTEIFSLLLLRNDLV